MKPIAAVAVALTMLSTTARAQMAAPPPLVEKVDVRVVNVDVTVTDNDGRPVRGLTRDDFEIFEDGARQPITHFDAIVKTAAQGATAAAAPTPERFKRKVLVLIDNLNTTMHGRNEALRNLEKFIDNDFAGDYEWSIAMTDRRVHLLLPLTSDKPRIHEVVSSVARRGTAKEITSPLQQDVRPSQTAETTPNENVVISNDESGLATFRESFNAVEQSMFAAQSASAISEAARAFASIEGKKIILLVTGRLPISTVNLINAVPGGDQFRAYSPQARALSTMQAANQRTASLRDLLIREANASNASFYIIGAEGLQTAEMSPVTQSQLGSALPDTSAMYWMARETGGRFMPGNRIGESLQQFDEISANFYSLGYKPTGDSTRYHRLKVRLKNDRGYHLQYREGFRDLPTDVQLERTLHSFLGVTMQPTNLPVLVVPRAAQYSKTQTNVGVLPFELSVPMDRLQYLDQAVGAKARVHMYVSVFDEQDRFVTFARYVQDVDLAENEQPAGRMVVNFPGVALRKGKYRLVVAVRDEIAESLGISVQRVQL